MFSLKQVSLRKNSFDNRVKNISQSKKLKRDIVNQTR